MPINIKTKENSAPKAETNIIDIHRKEQIERAIKIANSDSDTNAGKFPLEVFPSRIRAIISSWHECYGFPIDWYGTGVLSVAATACGNAYGAEYMPGWEAIPGFWAAIVGHSASGKTHVQRHVTRPLKSIVADMLEENAEKMQLWKNEEERRAQSKPDPTDEPNIMPQAKRLIVKNFTLETLQSILSANPRGCLVNAPELAGWLNGMNQYRSGNDEQVWLELYDHEHITKDTKEKTIRLSNPCVNVLGGVQPKIANIFSDKNRDSNGSLFRVLFAYPDNLDKPMPSKMMPGDDTWEAYEILIRRLWELPDRDNRADRLNEFIPLEIDTIFLKLDKEAREKYFKFLEYSTKKYNKTDDDRIKSNLGKMADTVLRFSTVLRLLRFVSYEEKQTTKKKSKGLLWSKDLTPLDMDNLPIEKEDIENSITLAEYYLNTSKKMLQTLDNEIERSMSPKHYKMYLALPEEGFQFSEAADILKTAFKISQSTVERYLRQHKKFFRLKDKIYYKKSI